MHTNMYLTYIPQTRRVWLQLSKVCTTLLLVVQKSWIDSSQKKLARVNPAFSERKLSYKLFRVYNCISLSV